MVREPAGESLSLRIACGMWLMRVGWDLQRLQSVPGLAHIHVFARRKSPEEIAEWKAAKEL